MEAAKTIDIQDQLQSENNRLNQAIAELQARLNGHQFTSVRPVSALDMFGDKWRTMIDGHVTPDDLFMYGKLDQLKPYDIMLASVYSDQEHHIQHGRRVTIIAEAGDMRYNGTHTVIGGDKHNIVIPVAKVGDAAGRYQNTDKVESSRKKVNALQERLAEINAEISGVAIPEQEIPQTEEQPLIQQPVQPQMKVLKGGIADQKEAALRIIEKLKDQVKVKQKSVQVSQIVMGIIAVAGVAGLLIMLMKNENKIAPTVEMKIAA